MAYKVLHAVDQIGKCEADHSILTDEALSINLKRTLSLVMAEGDNIYAAVKMFLVIFLAPGCEKLVRRVTPCMGEYRPF